MPESNRNEGDVAAIDRLCSAYVDVKTEMAKTIHGQSEVIEKLVICVLSGGHALLMGVPGLAKTLMIRSLADLMSLDFSRIQFTPDLMPADITGTEILQDSDQPGKRAFEFVKGPIFANIILADEINRTPPKTQAALLQAMQEHEVTAMGRTFELDEPFFVLATQNPIEQEGTYPLPEAQLDRFMFFIKVDYPSFDEELAVARTTTGSATQSIERIMSGDDIIAYQNLVRRVPVPDHMYEHVVSLVRKTRPSSKEAPEWINGLVTWGAGPRAVQYLILGAKAHAVLNGDYIVGKENIDAIAKEVLTHRILLSFHAETEGVTSEDIIDRLSAETSVG
ncbi:MAG: AAA domain-containing protein [Kiritimatiellaeota bacterium]|nr:AAA domain-containing protein [Kiritimatiellota bacterium]